MFTVGRAPAQKNPARALAPTGKIFPLNPMGQPARRPRRTASGCERKAFSNPSGIAYELYIAPPDLAVSQL